MTINKNLSISPTKMTWDTPFQADGLGPQSFAAKLCPKTGPSPRSFHDASGNPFDGLKDTGRKVDQYESKHLRHMDHFFGLFTVFSFSKLDVFKKTQMSFFFQLFSTCLVQLFKQLDVLLMFVCISKSWWISNVFMGQVTVGRFLPPVMPQDAEILRLMSRMFGPMTGPTIGWIQKKLEELEEQIYINHW